MASSQEPIIAYEAWLDKIKSKNIYREIKHHNGYRLDFTSSDYLQLSHNAKIISTMQQSASDLGLSGERSPAIGVSDAYFLLQKKMNEIKGTNGCMLYGSGYGANSSGLAALLNKEVVGEVEVFCDRENHKSIHEGIAISGQRQIRYKHCDMNNLEWLLKKSTSQARYVITESLFSMSGKATPMDELLFLKQKYDFFLYVDEAHSFGLIGKYGYGYSAANEQIDCIMGTFSKAIGIYGGYICSNSTIEKYLFNSSSGFIYSSALSPIFFLAIMQALDVLSNLNQKRDFLRELSSYAANKAQSSLGLLIDVADFSPIVPLIYNDNQEVLLKAKKLEANGIKISAIRHPSVNINKPRLRLTLNTSHTFANLDEVIALLAMD